MTIISMTETNDRPEDVVRFWTEAGEALWFARDDGFDDRFRTQFLAAHELAAAGLLGAWEETAQGALALLILLDQFPRNCFRGEARAFASDAQALSVADRALARGFDCEVEERLRTFFYLPYEHSERLADQERALDLFRPMGGEVWEYARLHHDVIIRFGRFPHRNSVLGRRMTEAEQAYLDGGGFQG